MSLEVFDEVFRYNLCRTDWYIESRDIIMDSQRDPLGTELYRVWRPMTSLRTDANLPAWALAYYHWTSYVVRRHMYALSGTASVAHD